MDRWFNPHHPQALQAAVFLGYLSAVFGLLQGPPFNRLLSILLFVCMGVGAFGTANNKRWGYWLLAVSSTLIAAEWILFLVQAIGSDVPLMLQALNATVFPVALVVAVFHAQSRSHQKLYFT